MGCKRVLSDKAVQEEILDWLRKVGYITVACRAAGVDPRRFQEWRKKWRDGDPAAEEFDEFFGAYERALAQMECELVHDVKEKPKGTRGKMWYLAKRWPERYGRRDPTTSDGFPLPPKAIENMTEGEVLVYLASLQGYIAGKLNGSEQTGGGALPGPQPGTPDRDEADE